MSGTGPNRTVLGQRIRQRRLTLEEFAEQLEVFAREHKDVGTLSLRHIQRLAAGELTHDWAPSDAEGDKILYVFDCGELGDDEREIQPDGVEIDHTEWVAVNRLGNYVIPRLERRLVHAHRAYTSDVILYLEHGQLRD